MKIGAIIMLVVALVLGGLSVFAARNWIERQVQGNAAAQKQQLEVVKIIVARTQLNFGDKVKDEHLVAMTWPKSSIPKGAFLSKREVLDGKKPRVALRRIEINEPLLKSKISGFGGRATLSAVLKSNRRAVTVRVNDVTGVSGFLLPGDRVDIMISRTVGGRKGARQTSLLLQDIRVLGVGQLASEKTDKPVVVRTLTVEATPMESQKLVLAQQVGTLSMVLRPVTERKIVRIKPVSTGDLLRDQSDPKRLTPPKPDVKKGVAQKKGSTAVASKPAPRRKVVLPKRDPWATIGITRGLRRSTQKVPQEQNGSTTQPPKPKGAETSSGGALPPPAKDPAKSSSDLGMLNGTVR